MLAAEPQVDLVLAYAKGLQNELNQANARSRPGITLLYLNLVRLFVLSRLPGYGKMPVIGGSAAVVCALSMVLSPFVFPSSLGSALELAVFLTVTGSGLAAAAILLLWPTESKRLTFQQLQGQCKEHKERADTLRPGVAQVWHDYNRLRTSLALCIRLDKARKKRDELATLLASEKYQLVHTDWRSMRGTDFG